MIYTEDTDALYDAGGRGGRDRGQRAVRHVPRRPRGLAARPVRAPLDDRHAHRGHGRGGDAAAHRGGDVLSHARTRVGSTSRCTPRCDEVAQPVDRVIDVDEAGVERRDAEPHGVGAAEVGDDVGALDQRLADRPRLGVAQATRASRACAASRGEPSGEAERRRATGRAARSAARSGRSTSRGAPRCPPRR